MDFTNAPLRPRLPQFPSPPAMSGPARLLNAMVMVHAARTAPPSAFDLSGWFR